MTRYRRLPAQYTSYRRRYASISTKEKLTVNRYKRWLRHIGTIYQIDHEGGILDEMERNNLKVFAIVLITMVQNILYVDIPRQPRVHHEPRTIASFSESDCWWRFRTRKEDLPRLMHVFGFLPNSYIYLHNGLKFLAEELFLFGLNRLSFPARLEDFCPIFGREFSQWSRAYTYFISRIYDGYSHLLFNNLEYWVDSFTTFSEAIRDKIIENGPEEYGNLLLCRIFAFIDCTVIATCRPGGGPLEPGPNAPRFHTHIQMSVYNGWKKHHGIKFQTVEAPNGMCIHMFGARSFRASDLDLFAESQINNQVAQLQQNAEQQYSLYGDGIYINASHTLSRCERVLNSMRISNEWDYMSTSKLFNFTKYKEQNKLLKPNGLVARQYVVATLLRNAHMCLYDGITSGYYDCPAPTLEHYFQVPHH